MSRVARCERRLKKFDRPPRSERPGTGNSTNSTEGEK
jgi:hypothetical protein